ncbi:hypothetical protein [Pseudomonas sp. nanlin1]|uniref:hypothetical protein n=1 Tax=Pseudomonas sp. nanlin1 TaxID=3040605 RepID=UPI003890A71A
MLRWLGACFGLCAALGAQAADYLAFEPVPGHGQMHYYSSNNGAPRAALIVLHGHPRDALRSFNAVTQALQGSPWAATTLLIAPQFQVGQDAAAHCTGPNVPAMQTNELLWTCRSWVEGAPADNEPAVTSFSALDALLRHLAAQWPSLRQVTVVGFSAGAQMVQHYIGFAQAAPDSIQAVRYAVASPGSYLYFDPARPFPVAHCPGSNRWRYGLEGAPPWLEQGIAQAKSRYATATIDYLVGALDSSQAPGAFYRILDKSCAAMAQGPFRLQRAQAYVAAENAQRPLDAPRRLTIVPGCGHDVTCVLGSSAAQQVLFNLLSPP